MATARKKRSIKEALVGIDQTLKELLLDRPLGFFQRINAGFRDLPRTNFLLGCQFAEQSKWLDATFRFKFALWLQPVFPQAWYNLGVCQLRLGKRADAKRSFLKAVAQKPGHEDAIFMLSAVDPASLSNTQLPRRMSLKNVVEFFTRVAPFYDALAQQNQYFGARLLFDHAKPLLARVQGLRVLDLGCGTGLASYSWRPLAAHIEGIDCCEPMVEVARNAMVSGAPLFNALRTEDMLAVGTNTLSPGAWDVILLADTAQFLGDLSELCMRVAGWLAPGGIFALTAEPYPAPTGYAVNPDTGRFGHHPDYVKKMAAQAGLELRKDLKVNLYANFPAHLFVFAAKAGAA
jgi:predicted TPR repeat methyltransferase